ncbi:MAG: hypothetical protein CML66_10015 [Rhodobacteraceae bacterium]|nr:hypothetical protein [Paracoccaceae bacterium]|tara:strand:- start:117 stop:458 length:342 start_codon:yes stop_codon:yes gene_type:complete
MWLRSVLSALFLTAALAVTSVVSAAMMAPDRSDAALDAFAEIYGGHLDVCGDMGGPDHHCPFCHGLPEVPAIGFDPVVFLLTPHDGWRRQQDLFRAAQSRDLNHSPRGPPVLA